MKVETKDYLEYYTNHSPELRNKLIIANSALVKRIARSYAKRTGIERADLEGYGYEGLIRAIDKYDPTTGNCFFTYAYPAINRKILAGISEISGCKREYHPECYQFYERLNQLMQTYGDQLSEQQLYEVVLNEIDLSPSEEKRLRINLVSSEEEPVLEKLENKNVTSIEENWVMLEQYQELRERLDEAISNLSPVYQDVIKRRFGLETNKIETAVEIARKHHCRYQNIYQKEVRALIQLKCLLREDGRQMLDFFDGNHVMIEPVQKVKK